jgi:proton-coupled amino acid transporter
MFRRAFLASRLPEGRPLPSVVTRNFIDFLVLYGHYGIIIRFFLIKGGDIEPEDDDEFQDEGGESQPLLRPANSTSAMIEGTSSHKAFFLLLKAFVGTGVLFLPKAFANGGMSFSIIVLFVIGCVTLHCMLMLVETSRAFGGLSFGDLGLKLYGTGFRKLVLFSIAGWF